MTAKKGGLIVLVIIVVAVAVLLAFVVPQFTQMFAEAGRDLPLLTRIVAGAGELVTNWWWLMALGLIGLVWWLRRDWQAPAGRARWDARLLRLPLLGPLIRKTQTARFSRTLSTLVENGVSLLKALSLVKDVISNRIIAEAIEAASDQLSHGKSLSEPLLEQGVFPKLALQMMVLLTLNLKK